MGSLSQRPRPHRQSRRLLRIALVPKFSAAITLQHLTHIPSVDLDGPQVHAAAAAPAALIESGAMTIHVSMVAEVVAGSASIMPWLLAPTTLLPTLIQLHQLPQ